jgi:hypothetical protein
MVSRKQLAQQLLEWVGRDRLEIIDSGSGWPSHLICKTDTGPLRLAAHLGTIGLSNRNRDGVERRFQNPGQDHPVFALPDEFPLLLGLTEIDGLCVLVGMDAQKRLGKTTRQSLFMPVELLDSGIARGWAEHVSEAGERLIAFAPPILPLFVDVYRAQRKVSEEEIQSALTITGVRLPP